MSGITDFYPLDFLQWIELPNDDHYAEPVFQMFPKQISRKEAAHFWALRKRAFDLHGHHAFTADIRASASFAADEADVPAQAAKRNVSVPDAQLAYRELVERWATIVAWRKTELAEFVQKEAAQQRQQAQERLAEEEKKTAPSSGLFTTNRSRTQPSDQNEDQHHQLTQEILQIEEEIEDFGRLNREAFAQGEAFSGATSQRMAQAQGILSHMGGLDPRVTKDQDRLTEWDHRLRYKNHARVEETAAVLQHVRRVKEDAREQLYEERGKLAW